MTAGEFCDTDPNERTLWKGVILYEDDAALRRANDLCDQLLNEEWMEADLHFDHWPMRDLAKEHAAKDAMESAVQADVVVVAALATGEFAGEVRAWLEHWAAHRSGREGALVGLLATEETRHVTGGPRDRFLHHLAVTAGMDYLNHLPLDAIHALPDEPDWCTSRAQAMTGTLDDILQTEPQPRLD